MKSQHHTLFWNLSLIDVRSLKAVQPFIWRESLPMSSIGRECKNLGLYCGIRGWGSACLLIDYLLQVETKRVSLAKRGEHKYISVNHEKDSDCRSLWVLIFGCRKLFILFTVFWNCFLNSNLMELTSCHWFLTVCYVLFL